MTHNSRCGNAKNPKCMCACLGARHGELLKKLLDEQSAPFRVSFEHVGVKK